MFFRGDDGGNFGGLRGLGGLVCTYRGMQGKKLSTGRRYRRGDI